MKKLSVEALRNDLEYDPETGIFRRRKSGEMVGSRWKSKGGPTYLKINVCGAQYYSHRLAWLYLYGEWPADGIDHINGDGTDNRKDNLRSANQAQNLTNVAVLKTNKTGLRGVYFHKGAKRYRAMISKNYKSIHIGYFDTPQEANQAYLAAADRLHGKFVRRS